MKIVFDIETSDIPDLVKNVEQIFCIALKVDDEPTKCFTYKNVPYSDGSLEEAYEILSKADLLIGHNITKFDIPVIEKFLGTLPENIVDTLIDAKLCYSKDQLEALDRHFSLVPKNLVGSYSLKAFGERLGNKKTEYEDFSSLSKEMVEYCKQDVEVTKTLYEHLLERLNYPSEFVRNVEYKVARISYEQEQFGVYFDIDKAMKVATNLRFKALNSENVLRKVFPSVFVADGDIVFPKINRRVKKIVDTSYPLHIHPYSIPFEIGKNGKYKVPSRRKITFLPKGKKLIYEQYVEDCPYQRIKLQKFNPNSRSQIIDRLIQNYDFKPTNYTEIGNPQLNEDVIDTLLKELE